MANKKTVETVEPMEVMEAEPTVEATDHEDFVTRKLKAINAMQKPLKAEKSASRLLRKARN